MGGGKKVKKTILTIIDRMGPTCKSILIITLILWQLLMIFTISGFSTWDPGIIVLQATGQKQWVPDYFSYNPNTLPLMFFEHFVWRAIGSPSYKVLTIVLNIINMMLVDTSVYCLMKSLQYKYNRRIRNYIFLCICLLMLITPWICLPYSDPLSFAFTIFVFLGLKKLNKDYSLGRAISVGLLVAINYFIKPSTIIVVIAYVIVSIIFSFSSKDSRKTHLGGLIKRLVIIFMIFFTAIWGFNFYKAHNSVIKIDNSKALNLVHFADMGITGTGGYNLQDVEHDYKIKDPKNRLKSDKRIWMKRFNNMGPLKYQLFLVRKQVANTEDSSFNWGKEGEFIRSNSFSGSQYLLTRKLFLDNDGVARKYQELFAIVIQACWIIVLICLLFTFENSDYDSQFLKYAIVGFFAFLLIFESGRSRYLIQFLPLMVLLSGIGYGNIRHKAIKD